MARDICRAGFTHCLINSTKIWRNRKKNRLSSGLNIVEEKVREQRSTVEKMIHDVIETKQYENQESQIR